MIANTSLERCTCDALVIANGSQTIADTENSNRGQRSERISCGDSPSIRLVPNARTCRDAWMVGSTQTHTDTGLATIEGIDLDADVPCAGFGCIEGDHPADYIIGFVWPHGHIYRGARCDTWWKSDVRLRCMHCDVSAEDRDDVAHIVEVLR